MKPLTKGDLSKLALRITRNRLAEALTELEFNKEDAGAMAKRDEARAILQKHGWTEVPARHKKKPAKAKPVNPLGTGVVVSEIKAGGEEQTGAKREASDGVQSKSEPSSIKDKDDGLSADVPIKPAGLPDGDESKPPQLAAVVVDQPPGKTPVEPQGRDANAAKIDSPASDLLPLASPELKFVPQGNTPETAPKQNLGGSNRSGWITVKGFAGKDRALKLFNLGGELEPDPSDHKKKIWLFPNEETAAKAQIILNGK